MNRVDLIEKKRDGGELSTQEIAEYVTEALKAELE